MCLRLGCSGGGFGADGAAVDAAADAVEPTEEVVVEEEEEAEEVEDEEEEAEEAEVAGAEVLFEAGGLAAEAAPKKWLRVRARLAFISVTLSRLLSTTPPPLSLFIETLELEFDWALELALELALEVVAGGLEEAALCCSEALSCQSTHTPK